MHSSWSTSIMFPVILAMMMISLGGIADAQMTQAGNCTIPPAIENFDKTKYLGRWYETYRLYDGRNNYTQVTLNLALANGTNFTSHQMGYENTKMFHMDGLITNGNDSSKFSIFYPSTGVTYPHWVISTDYVSYSYVGGCVFNATTASSVHYGWLYSRTSHFNLGDMVALAPHITNDTNLKHMKQTPAKYCNGSTEVRAMAALVLVAVSVSKFFTNIF